MTEKEAIRQEIDALDQELLTLLNRRQTLAQNIGRIKNREGKGTLDFQREEEVLAHLMHLNPGPLSPAALRNIFREIISAAREVQIPFGVAFLGPEATFSHLAALKKFGRATRYGPLATIQEVFSEVEKGKYQYGVVPIENSTEGIVNVSLDLFADTSVKICGELYLEVSHDLVNKSGQLADIEVIYTHPQAYAQCRGWLSAHLPDVPVIEVASTGVAAQKAAKNPNAAAILHDGKWVETICGILDNRAKEICDEKNNFINDSLILAFSASFSLWQFGASGQGSRGNFACRHRFLRDHC